MKREKICLVGGTGFVGGHLLSRLAPDYEVVVLSRNPSAQRANWVLPNTRFKRVDIYDVAALSRQFQDATAVVNLAGILNEQGNDGLGFRRAHVRLVERILEACKHAGVGRFLHVSALKAGEGQSHYLQSKGEAETLIRGQHDVAWTIFQPSVIFGPGDNFLNRFADLLKMMPVLIQPCAESKLQPVYVGDVVEAIVRCLEDEATAGNTFQLAGPKVFSLLELLDYLRNVLALKRIVAGMPDGMSRFVAGVMDWLPANIKPFSKDNYLSLQTDSVATHNGLARLGIRPVPLETVAPGYLVPERSAAVRSQRYHRFRERARR